MRIILIIALLISLQPIFSQNHSCCSAPDAFAGFTSDNSFVVIHEDPIPFTFVSLHGGNTITYICPDGKTASAFYIAAAAKSDKYLFVVHEWWGLNNYIKQMAEKLYHDLGNKVNVIAVDLYDGKVAVEKQVASEYMKGLDAERAKSIIQGAIQYAGENAKIATIGWCMGGGYSLQASILAGEKAAGCVMYYGFPETDPEKIKTLQADVLMIWPNQDKWINKQVVDEFKLKMEAAEKNITVREYNADHAFANPSNPGHNPEMTTDAYLASLAFLKLKLEI